MAKEKSPREKSTPKSGTPAGMREGMKKATTGMLVLFLLQQKPMYTYDIMRRVEEITKGALTFNTPVHRHLPPEGIRLCGRI